MLTMPNFSPQCDKNIQSMNVLVTGCQGIGLAICENWSGHNVTCVSQSTGHDINCWSQWIADFYEFDVFVNNAQSAWCQTELLIHMADRWRNQPSRTIINIGSTVASYGKSHGDDREFSQYRNQKRTLQDAFQQLVQQCQCRLILINPGPTDTDLMQGVAVDKMSVDCVAKYVQLAMDYPEIKRLDIWQ